MLLAPSDVESGCARQRIITFFLFHFQNSHYSITVKP